MSVTIEEKIAAVESVLDWYRDSGMRETPTFRAMKEIARELRAETPAEAGRVLAAMTDEVGRARRSKARLGCLSLEHAQSIAEAVCGRWWPTIRRALELHERETEKTA